MIQVLTFLGVIMGSNWKVLYREAAFLLTFMFAKSHSDHSVQNEFERVNIETSKVGAAQATNR